MTDTIKIHILDKGVSLFHIKGGFMTSLDSVMLSAACPAKNRQEETILDMGCGVGGVGLAILHRLNRAKLTGVDILEDNIKLAKKNAVENKVTNRCEFICSDIRDYVQSNEGKTGFDHVVCNPPYLEAGTHFTSPNTHKATANGNIDKNISLKDWIDCGFVMLKQKGSLTIIHRADMVDKIITALGRRFGKIEIIPLFPKSGKNANRVIVRAIKGRKSPATIHPGFILHNDDGSYTKTAESILRNGHTI